MSASEVHGEVGVIVLSNDNRWAHAYASQHDALTNEALQARKDITFFDAGGHALVAVTGEDGRVHALKHSDAPADPDKLRDRLHTILRQVPEVVRQRQGSFKQDPADEQLTVEEKLAQLPSLQGADLAQTLELYRSILGPHSMGEELQHKGGWFHNVFAHGW
ncbi:hypothetical protein [Kineosporia babensis]|uniref:Uncharacterized protein n=1 Tax=Kineosporia babensis TaxID=499548 RepID=A0A9X1NC81_9ACTN|nr:hypothetical protein [Kineosporia babensis]MCD5310611.1 hypothetical protein [Kineosporia babensis]